MPRSAASCLLVGLAVTLGVGAGGCYFVRSPSRPVPALELRREADVRQRCLVVMIPGFLDGPWSYVENRFPNDLIGSGAPCDMVAVDLHFRYYADDGASDAIYEDILVPATARGYEEIWLVGISMGGLGTLMTAARHPELVDGILLIAPFVGEERTLHAIEEAGGAVAWRPPAELAAAGWTNDNYTDHIWAWLRGYHNDPDARPPLYVGWGADDRLGAADRLLADLMPEDHVFGAPGGHNWATWRPIWQDMVRAAPLGRLTVEP